MNNVGTVYKTARKFYQKLFNVNCIGYLTDMDDFVQAANVGLLRAIDRYDYGHESGAKFNTFAHYSIIFECQNCYNSNQLITVPPKPAKDTLTQFNFYNLDTSMTF